MFSAKGETFFSANGEERARVKYYVDNIVEQVSVNPIEHPVCIVQKKPIRFFMFFSQLFYSEDNFAGIFGWP
jgi:hypothetical protein